MEQDDVLQRLTRIETKLDTYLVDHETRLRSVESKQYYLAGFAALGAYIVTKLPWTMHIG